MPEFDEKKQSEELNNFHDNLNPFSMLDDRFIYESSKGIFEHIIEYKHTIDGKEFVYKAKIFVVNSDNIFDYASEAGFSYKEYGSTYNAFVTDDDEDIINIVDRYESVNVRNLRDYDSPFAECINGYTLNSEKSTYGFTDLTKKDSLFYIKYVFEKDGNEKEVYVDLGYKSDGVIPKGQFNLDPDFKFEGNVKGTYTSDDEEDTVDEEANINEGAE